MPRIFLSDRPSLSPEDRARLEATTEEDIQRHIVEDDGVDLGEVDTGELRVNRAYPDLRELRERFCMTQEEFARTFGLNIRSLRDWEQRKAEPDGAARILLRVIEQNPDVVRRAASITP